jgi:hypothetical protein
MEDRFNLPTSSRRPNHRDEEAQPHSGERQPVILYIRAKGEDLDPLLHKLRKFAEYGHLQIVEEFVEEGRLSDAWNAASRHLSVDTAHDCGLLIPHLDVLGANRREVRSRMAALREMNVTIYEAEAGAKITWVNIQVSDG